MCAAPAMESTTRAGDARRISVAQILVYELRVRDAMSKSPITAAPTDSLRSIQNLMKTHRFSGVPITQQGQLLGIISIEDIIDALDHGHINEPASKWMAKNVISLRDHYSLVRAVAEFDRHGFGRFPVLDTKDQLVGIITRGDITGCLMQHLERRAEEAVASEARLVADRQPDGVERSVTVRAHIKSGDFDGAGRLSQRMREVLRERGIDPDIRRRAAVISYEAETNIIVHSLGGDITATIFPEKVIIEAVDQGPGIERIDLAMREGWSTAGPLARELGFGAGMGLPNIKKCSDRFEIQSELGKGTRLHCEVLLRKANQPS